MKLLDNIKKPSDLNDLTINQLDDLAKEIREFLLENISTTGGHLSSNLGVVELTIALHKVFDSPKDKIIWDVGHQGYIHKILTGRQAEFKSLRQLDGMSGFLKASESEHDAYDAGHSSTSISAALGYAKAFSLQGKSNKSIAVIGDGALTGGVAFEAMNFAGHSKENVIVILNDNEMSISNNVGALSSYLTKIRTAKTYYEIKINTSNFFKKIPLIGNVLLRGFTKIKNSFKQLLIKGMLFEEFGFTYIGVVDGHNIKKLTNVLEDAKYIQGPVLIHVSTKKGKGYALAEKEPEKYHAVSKFDLEKGIVSTKGILKYQDILGKSLIKLAKDNKDVIAITAAMPSGTGLSEFSKLYPEQFMDVGIAEQNAVIIAAGLAKENIKPFVCIYSTFLQRAYDQILHDVCIQNLNVVFCIDRAGLVGQDGETHQGMFDLSYLSHIPNMTVLAPKDKSEFENMITYAYKHIGPIAIRYPRGNAIEINNKSINNCEMEILAEGKDCLIIAVGKMVSTGLDVVSSLKDENISATLINPRKLFPMSQNILQNINKYDNIYTIEDNVIVGGYGSYIESLSEYKIKKFALPLKFIEHGTVESLYRRYNLDVDSIFNSILEDLKGRE